MSAKVDLTGQRFGRLIVIKELPRKTALRKTPLWLCQCDCGNTCEAYSDSLRGELWLHFEGAPQGSRS